MFASLESKISELESCGDVNKISTVDKEDLYAELDDRRTRAKNIIIYGLPNRSDESNDLEFVNDILEQISDFPLAKSARKIGSSRDRNTVPIKLTFESESDARHVLKFKNKLGKFKITAKNDLTSEQQKYIKHLSQELDLRIKNGEKDLTIRYIKGTPKIVPKINSYANKKKN